MGVQYPLAYKSKGKSKRKNNIYYNKKNLLNDFTQFKRFKKQLRKKLTIANIQQISLHLQKYYLFLNLFINFSPVLTTK